MRGKIIHKLRNISVWYFILAAIVLSEILTVIFSTIVSKILWGHVSHEVLIIGFFDAFIVCLIVVLITVYLIKQITHLTLVNERLQVEIAGRRQAEEALQKAHDELEAKVEDRTANLAEANKDLQHQISERKKAEQELKSFTERLKKSNKELQDFSNIVSHDLQEPLRKVMTFGDRLKDNFADKLGEQGRDYLERMQNATRRMQTFINDLLQFSRVTTKAQPFAPVDLGKIAGEVVSDLEVRIAQTGGTVEVNNLPVIDADPLQMRQLLQNLVGNALKFNKKNQPPVVKVTGKFVDCDELRSNKETTNGEFYQLTVEDKGIGFDEKHVDRIFGVFQRLHGRNAYEGTGIGLSVCKSIVERHGGSITAKSKPGKGAIFIVTLPVKHKEEA